MACLQLVSVNNMQKSLSVKGKITYIQYRGKKIH